MPNPEFNPVSLLAPTNVGKIGLLNNTNNDEEAKKKPFVNSVFTAQPNEINAGAGAYLS